MQSSCLMTFLFVVICCYLNLFNMSWYVLNVLSLRCFGPVLLCQDGSGSPLPDSARDPSADLQKSPRPSGLKHLERKLERPNIPRLAALTDASSVLPDASSVLPGNLQFTSVPQHLCSWLNQKSDFKPAVKLFRINKAYIRHVPVSSFKRLYACHSKIESVYSVQSLKSPSSAKRSLSQSIVSFTQEGTHH